MLSFDDFSIKRKYKEKTVKNIKISLEIIPILFLFISYILLFFQSFSHIDLGTAKKNPA